MTVVTPSFNQGGFLEATIRSVLLQGYPDLEYIVMDGGSSDQSDAIIRKYAPWLSFWRSGPDDGQSDAINAGFERATGTVIGWLNSDDIYYSGALASGCAALADGEADLFVGAMDKVRVEDGEMEFVKLSTPHTGSAIHHFPIFEHGRRYPFHFTQPPAFWTRSLWERTGGLDERYHYQMDREWLLRALALGIEVRTGDPVMARFTLHPGSKSNDFQTRFQRERAQLYFRLSRRPGFRFLPCVASGLPPLQQSLYARAMQVRESRGRGASMGLRLGSAAIGLLRRLPGMKGDKRVTPSPGVDR